MINRRKNFTFAVMLTILSVLLFLVALNGCAPAEYQYDSTRSGGDGIANAVQLSSLIYKFNDGPVTCYVYKSYGISCVIP